MDPKDQAEKVKEEIKTKDQNDTPQEAVPDEMPAPDVYSILREMPGAPNQEQIDRWKTQTEVFTSILSEADIYIWRPVNWHEYKQLQKTSAEHPENPSYYDEQLVYKCVLWPKLAPEHLPSLKGGTIPTLSQQIMGGSNFIPPAVAMEFVVKL